MKRLNEKRERERENRSKHEQTEGKKASEETKSHIAREWQNV